MENVKEKGTNEQKRPTQVGKEQKGTCEAVTPSINHI
jgi:hypothetical protein